MVYFDVAGLILLVAGCVLYVALSASSRQRQDQLRRAYLGYAVCAMGVGLFQLHLHVDGPVVFMMFGLFLVPIVVSAGAAVLNTLGARSAALWALAGATSALAAGQLLASFGVLGSFMNAIAKSYVAFVSVVCIVRYRDWGRGNRQA